MTDTNNPSFLLFPVNGNRTAWRPVSLPVVLIVPHRRDRTGFPIDDSQVFDVRIYIENTPRQSLVAGHNHIGVKYPDHELFISHVDAFELAANQIDPSAHDIVDATGQVVTSASDGDFINYTTASGTRGQIPYIVGADYYDLSSFQIETEILQSGLYNIVYECGYFNRAITTDGSGSFLCIDVTVSALAILKFKLNHPGDVLEEFYRLTPSSPYLGNTTKATDTTVAFYRPFTDILQDVMDEQELLGKLNWVYDAPPEVIPYLSSLLGWDIPYFPQSLDQLRKAVLRRTVEFQHLKGSRTALVNLFKLFGFDISITNLWYNLDETGFITPSATASVVGESIIITKKYQTDLLLDHTYTKNGFGTFSIPLLFNPQVLMNDMVSNSGTVTVDSYIVEVGSDTHTILQQIATQIKGDPVGYDSNGSVDNEGFTNPLAIHNAISGHQVVGYSQILLSTNGNAINSLVAGIAPVLPSNIKFSKDSNSLAFSLNGYIDYSEHVVFVFASYERHGYSVPVDLENNRSSRFSIQVMANGAAADPQTMDFIIEFVNRLKAFHSYLYLVKTDSEITETYEVGGFCVGGDIAQRYDIEAGMLQVPPAIIPRTPTNLTSCSDLDPTSLGYKDADIELRMRKLRNLSEEFNAWYDLGATANGQAMIVPDSQTLVRSVEYGPSPNANLSAKADPSQYGLFNREATSFGTQLFKIDGSTDYCYRARVQDEMLTRSIVANNDSYHNHPCSIGMGTGVYWTYPASTVIVRNGVQHPRSLSRAMIISGSAPTTSSRFFLDGIQGPYITGHGKAFLSKLYAEYGANGAETLHYTNDGTTSFDQRQQLALQRPSLNIIKPTAHLPGCRFARFNALYATFTHPTHAARPWDDQFIRPCSTTSAMSVEISQDTSDDEILVFESTPFVITGNGLAEDIASFSDAAVGSHSDVVDSDVVHRVYMNNASGHAAITLDGDDFDTPVANGLIETNDPLFNSHSTCGTIVLDFADGYPSSSGLVNYDAIDIGRGGLFTTIFADLGVPADTAPTQVLFLFGSGIRFETGVRFDCGCAVVDCGGTSDQSTLCTTGMYLDGDGHYDYSPDHTTYDLVMENADAISCEEVLFDGRVPSFLELLS